MDKKAIAALFEEMCKEIKELDDDLNSAYITPENRWKVEQETDERLNKYRERLNSLLA